MITSLWVCGQALARALFMFSFFTGHQLAEQHFFYLNWLRFFTQNQDSFTKNLVSLHQEFGFQQFVKFPTHSKGNILDLVFSTEDLIRSTYPLPLVLSDHTPIVIEMNKMMAREKNLLKFCCYNHEKIKEFVEEFSVFDFDDLVMQTSQHSGFD